MPSPKPPARSAVLYARVSSKEQEKEGFSIPAQEKLLREYAGRERLEVVREFVDVETAKQAGRSGFGEMVEFLGEGGADVLLVEKTDRLYRNIRDWVTIDDLSVEIHFVKEGVVYSEASKSSEKFMHGIKVLMAKNYVDNLSEETRKGMTEKAAQGIWPSWAPLGYVNVTDDAGRRTIAPDPVVGPLVRRLFEWYAEGDHSLGEAVQWCDEHGLRTRKGKKIHKSHVHHMLRTLTYCGRFVWKGTLYRGSYEPLFSRELWDKVQEALDGSSRAKRASRGEDTLIAYAGMVTCGVCGRLLCGDIKKKKYVYYRCTRPREECPRGYVKQKQLDEGFLEAVKALHIDAEVVRWLVEALKESHADEERLRAEAIAGLEADVARLERRLSGLYEDKLDGRIAVSFYDQKHAEWTDEVERAEEQIARHRGAHRANMAQGVQLLELLQRMVELYVTQEPRERRRLLEFVCSNSVWRDGKLEVTYRQPFDVLAVTGANAKASEAAGASEADVRSNWLPESMAESVVVVCRRVI